MPKNKDELPKLSTIKQAAEILNVHMETLKRWDRTGRLRAFRVNERGDRRYKLEDLESYLKKKK